MKESIKGVHRKCVTDHYFVLAVSSLFCFELGTCGFLWFRCFQRRLVSKLWSQFSMLIGRFGKHKLRTDIAHWAIPFVANVICSEVWFNRPKTLAYLYYLEVGVVFCPSCIAPTHDVSFFTRHCRLNSKTYRLYRVCKLQSLIEGY